MPPEHRVTRARAEDVPEIAAVAARAFLDDPVMTWLVPQPRGRLRRLEHFFVAAIGRMIAGGFREVYTTEERAGEATWAPPGGWKVPVARMLPGVAAMLRAIGPGGMLRSARLYATLAAHHPPEPHWYLEGIATDPPRQGTGVATALMTPVLQRCDAEGIPAYLETQNPENLPFYARRGFDVVGEIDLPMHGPHMWLMLRRPR